MKPLILLLFLAVGLVVSVFFVLRLRKERARKSEFTPTDFTININTSFVPGDRSTEKQVNDNDSDAWEGGFWDAPDPKQLSAHLKFDYVDGNRNPTARSVVVKSFDNSLYGGILLGHCELRDATRTFRFDRIRRCVHLDTGIAVSNVRAYINQLYKESPEYSAELLVTDYLDVIKVLYFVAKADGQFRKEEKIVVTEYVKQLVRDNRLTVAMIEDAMKDVDPPSIHGFRLAVGRVVKGGEINPELLLKCCEEIVATQKSFHPSESEALRYISAKASELRKA